MISQIPQSFEIFYSYAHEDEALRDQLDKHLATLKWQGLITGWHDRKITAGTQWSDEIDIHLKSANIILLLVSSDFIASPYCYGIEMKQAIQRHKNGEAYVIPIILRPVDWTGTPFAKLQALPKDGKPIITWSPIDNAFLEIAKGIRNLVEGRKKDPSTISTLLATSQEQEVRENVSDEQMETLKQELDVLFFDKRDLLDMIARECHLNVPYSSDFKVYRSNVLSEAVKNYKVAVLTRKILNEYNRPKLKKLLSEIEKTIRL